MTLSAISRRLAASSFDGYVNTPVALTVPQLEALPGQETLNITYLNHLGVASSAPPFAR
jgi:hypothetical protein